MLPNNLLVGVILISGFLNGQELEFNFKLQSLTNNNYLIYMEEHIPLNNTPNDQMILTICLGNPQQCFNVLLDSGSFLLWVSDTNCYSCPNSMKKYDRSISKTYQNLNKEFSIQYGTGSIKGELAKEVITLGNFKLSDFVFVLAQYQSDMEDIDGILGLGKSYDEMPNQKQVSFIDQLHYSKYISQRIFTQKYINEKEGIMTIGDLPSEIKNNKNEYSTCDTIQFYNGRLDPYWECNLSFIMFDGQVYEIDEPTLLDTGTNQFIVPYSFLYYLSETYFKDLLDRKLCNLISQDFLETPFSIMCSLSAYSIINNLPDMYIVLGDYVNKSDQSVWAIKLSYIDLFFVYRNHLVFLLKSTRNINKWIIGQPILKKFHMVFDKENEQIGFYQGPQEYINLPKFEPKFKYWFTLIIIVVIILLIITCGYIINLCKRRDERNENNLEQPILFRDFYQNRNRNRNQRHRNVPNVL